MLFNSASFFLFLPIVFILFWIAKKNLTTQNIIILVSSYVFYGWWDWRFLLLILFSTLNDYFIGIEIGKSDSSKRKKLFLWLSIISNLGVLLFFKYCDFFIENFASVLEAMSFKPNISSLNIILPVGISFYTFQTLSYTIDVYRGNLKPTKNIIAFGAFISFFPQLVAGPIERATNLLPQFFKKKNFDYSLAIDGVKQALWGFFKKIVIADHCAIYANEIFGTVDSPVDYSTMPGGVLCMGAIYFAFQIYGDFSGYSDIAIGTSKIFGFKLMKNFNFPYFSRDIAEFWRRWHISLSTWFRDYLYIPLGGSKGTVYKQIRNVMIIFIVSGFWHGSKWTFVIWGALNALYFIPFLLLRLNRKNTSTVISKTFIPDIRTLGGILLTFMMACFAWIFFRAESANQAFNYIGEIFKSDFIPSNFYFFHPLIIFQIFVFILLEWVNRENTHPFEFHRKCPKLIRWGIYYTFIIVILFSANYHESSDFIYFQF